MCDFINAHEELVHITAFGECRDVIRRIMRVIKEAHNTQRKRRLSGKKKRSDETMKRTQRAKALVAIVKHGKMTKVEAREGWRRYFGKETDMR